jgi:hypothetical protein
MENLAKKIIFQEMNFLVPLLFFTVFEPDHLQHSVLTSYDTVNHVPNVRMEHLVTNTNGRLLGSITYFITTGEVYYYYIDITIQNKDDVMDYLLTIAKDDLLFHNVKQLWKMEYKGFLIFGCCGVRKDITVNIFGKYDVKSL